MGKDKGTPVESKQLSKLARVWKTHWQGQELHPPSPCQSRARTLFFRQTSGQIRAVGNL